MKFGSHVGTGISKYLHSAYFGDTHLSGFPDQDYQRVEYIETDGKAYILTNHITSSSTRTVSKFSNMDPSLEGYIYGSYGQSKGTQRNLIGYGYGGSGLISTMGNYSIYYASSYFSESDTFVIDEDYNSISVTIRDETITKEREWTSYREFEKPDNPNIIFGVNAMNSGSESQVWETIPGLRLHKYETYNDSDLVRQYIPCYRRSDGEPGLYEMINGIFYENAGSDGEFSCGPIISETSGIGLAKRILKGYIGDKNNIARKIYQYRLFLFKDGADNTAITGGWTGAFTHTTNDDSAYTMTRMTINGQYISGSFSSSNGTSEKALYVRSVNAIDMTKYKKLCCLLEWYTSRASIVPSDAYFGVFNSSYTKSRTNQLESRYLAFGRHSVAVNSDYQETLIEIDISDVNGVGYILYDKYYGNMNAAISVRIKQIWLEL